MRSARPNNVLIVAPVIEVMAAEAGVTGAPAA